MERLNLIIFGFIAQNFTGSLITLINLISAVAAETT